LPVSPRTGDLRGRHDEDRSTPGDRAAAAQGLIEPELYETLALETAAAADLFRKDTSERPAATVSSAWRSPICYDTAEASPRAALWRRLERQNALIKIPGPNGLAPYAL